MQHCLPLFFSFSFYGYNVASQMIQVSPSVCYKDWERLAQVSALTWMRLPNCLYLSCFFLLWLLKRKSLTYIPRCLLYLLLILKHLPFYYYYYYGGFLVSFIVWSHSKCHTYKYTYTYIHLRAVKDYFEWLPMMAIDYFDSLMSARFNCIFRRPWRRLEGVERVLLAILLITIPLKRFKLNFAFLIYLISAGKA